MFEDLDAGPSLIASVLLASKSQPLARKAAHGSRSIAVAAASVVASAQRIRRPNLNVCAVITKRRTTIRFAVVAKTQSSGNEMLSCVTQSAHGFTLNTAWYCRCEPIQTQPDGAHQRHA